MFKEIVHFQENNDVFCSSSRLKYQTWGYSQIIKVSVFWETTFNKTQFKIIFLTFFAQNTQFCSSDRSQKNNQRNKFHFSKKHRLHGLKADLLLPPN